MVGNRLGYPTSVLRCGVIPGRGLFFVFGHAPFEKHAFFVPFWCPFGKHLQDGTPKLEKGSDVMFQGRRVSRSVLNIYM